jgi:hypothetical protein
MGYNLSVPEIRKTREFAAWIDGLGEEPIGDEDG